AENPSDLAVYRRLHLLLDRRFEGRAAVRCRWRRRIVAKMQQQAVEFNQDALQRPQFGPELICGIERGQRSAHALAMPPRREWPNVRVQDMPGNRVEMMAVRMLFGDLAGGLEERIQAVERSLLDAIEIGKSLRADAGHELGVQLRGRLSVVADRCPR